MYPSLDNPAVCPQASGIGLAGLASAVSGAVMAPQAARTAVIMKAVWAAFGVVIDLQASKIAAIVLRSWELNCGDSGFVSGDFMAQIY